MTFGARIAATIGEKNAQQAETASIELDLASSVAQLYFALQAANAKLELVHQLKSIAQLSVDAHQHRTQRGLEDDVDIANAQVELLSVNQQQISVETLITQYRETLRALLGADSVTLPEIYKKPLPTVQERLPESLSFELLARRPDLQALQAYVKASLSQIDVAKAEFYPRFDIKGFWSYNNLHIGDLFKSSSQQFTLIPGLYLPIFDGGRLNAQLKFARTDSNILIKQYNQAVLDAVRDIAITSNNLNELNQRFAYQKLKVNAEMTAAKSATAHYQRGLLSFYSSQEVRRLVIAEQLVLLEIQAQRLSTDIRLTKALGGGFRGNQMPPK